MPGHVSHVKTQWMEGDEAHCLGGGGAQPSILTHIPQTYTVPRVASENEEGVAACAISRL